MKKNRIRSNKKSRDKTIKKRNKTSSKKVKSTKVKSKKVKSKKVRTNKKNHKRRSKKVKTKNKIARRNKLRGGSDSGDAATHGVGDDPVRLKELRELDLRGSYKEIGDSDYSTRALTSTDKLSDILRKLGSKFVDIGISVSEIPQRVSVPSQADIVKILQGSELFVGNSERENVIEGIADNVLDDYNEKLTIPNMEGVANRILNEMGRLDAHLLDDDDVDNTARKIVEMFSVEDGSSDGADDRRYIVKLNSIELPRVVPEISVTGGQLKEILSKMGRGDDYIQSIKAAIDNDIPLQVWGVSEGEEWVFSGNVKFYISDTIDGKLVVQVNNIGTGAFILGDGGAEDLYFTISCELSEWLSTQTNMAGESGGATSDVPNPSSRNHKIKLTDIAGENILNPDGEMKEILLTEFQISKIEFIKNEFIRDCAINSNFADNILSVDRGMTTLKINDEFYINTELYIQLILQLEHFVRGAEAAAPDVAGAPPLDVAETPPPDVAETLYQINQLILGSPLISGNNGELLIIGLLNLMNQDRISDLYVEARDLIDKIDSRLYKEAWTQDNMIKNTIIIACVSYLIKINSDGVDVKKYIELLDKCKGYISIVEVADIDLTVAIPPINPGRRPGDAGEPAAAKVRSPYDEYMKLKNPNEREISPETLRFGKELGEGGESKVILSSDEQYVSKMIVLTGDERNRKSTETYLNFTYENMIRLQSELDVDKKYFPIAYNLLTDLSNSTMFLAMEYFRGYNFNPGMFGRSRYIQNLEQLVEKDILTLDQREQYCRELARGIAAMHSIGIWHGDLKTENIIIEGNVNASQLKIIDIGGNRAGNPMRSERSGETGAMTDAPALQHDVSEGQLAIGCCEYMEDNTLTCQSYEQFVNSLTSDMGDFLKSMSILASDELNSREFPRDVGASSDWWTYGLIVFEIMMGVSLYSYNVSGNLEAHPNAKVKDKVQGSNDKFLELYLEQKRRLKGSRRKKNREKSMDNEDRLIFRISGLNTYMIELSIPEKKKLIEIILDLIISDKNKSVIKTLLTEDGGYERVRAFLELSFMFLEAQGDRPFLCLDDGHARKYGSLIYNTHKTMVGRLFEDGAKSLSETQDTYAEVAAAGETQRPKTNTLTLSGSE